MLPKSRVFMFMRKRSLKHAIFIAKSLPYSDVKKLFCSKQYIDLPTSEKWFGQKSGQKQECSCLTDWVGQGPNIRAYRVSCAC